MDDSGFQAGSTQKPSRAIQECASPDDNIRAGLSLASQALVDALLAETPTDEVLGMLEHAMLAVQHREEVFGIIPCEIAQRRLGELMRAVRMR